MIWLVVVQAAPSMVGTDLSQTLAGMLGRLLPLLYWTPQTTCPRVCCAVHDRDVAQPGSVVDWAWAVLLHALTGTWTLVCESTVVMASRLAQSAANAAKEGTGSKTRHFFLEVAFTAQRKQLSTCSAHGRRS
jgi:hypothetical protein